MSNEVLHGSDDQIVARRGRSSREISSRAKLLRAVKDRPTMAVATTTLAGVALIAALAPILAPYDPRTIYGSDFAAPSGAHVLGLDYSGHDVVSVLIWGGRGSLTIGFLAALVSLAVGGVAGLVGGYFGGMADSVIAAATDFFLVIPVLPLMIIVSALYGTGEADLIFIIGLLSWMSTARLVRAQVSSDRERVYVRRARALGAGHFRTIVKHVLPHVAPTLAATTALAVGSAIFFASALSFLGLSDASRPDWGNMIALGFRGGAISARAWWDMVPPGAAIAVVVLCCSLVARGLDRVFNPRLDASYLSRRSFCVRRTSGLSDDRAEERP
jgi:peptide/nickel transport system permease protein